MTTEFCLITTVTNDKNIAIEITNKLLGLGLAACVQISEIESYFFWDGNLKTEKEYKITIKTMSEYYKKIEATILSLHNYEIAEIIKLTIDYASPSYLAWLRSSLQEVH